MLRPRPGLVGARPLEVVNGLSLLTPNKAPLAFLTLTLLSSRACTSCSLEISLGPDL